VKTLNHAQKQLPPPPKIVHGAFVATVDRDRRPWSRDFGELVISGQDFGSSRKKTSVYRMESALGRKRSLLGSKFGENKVVF